MKILASLHDPKKERYAIYYSTILTVVTISSILLATGIIEFSPIEGVLVFVEGFIALYMLARHEKVSYSFSNHMLSFDLRFRNLLNLLFKN